jgi:hypothetical protein
MGDGKHCAHVCTAPLVCIEGRWFHANGAPVHDAEPGDDPRALLRGAEERLEATEARLALAERISAARLEELLRVETRLLAQRALVEAALAATEKDDYFWFVANHKRMLDAARAHREAQEGSQ